LGINVVVVVVVVLLRVLITQSIVILINFHPHYVKLNLPSGYKTIACLNYASNADFTLFPVAALFRKTLLLDMLFFNDC
jgi:hypothetical protein